MEKIATDTYSFERLRQGGYVYVDKTGILLSLANGSLGTQFFIARPRRFGKSLTVSTLQCLFEGRRFYLSKALGSRRKSITLIFLMPLKLAGGSRSRVRRILG